ncbi:hypothetical protein N9Z79_01965 [Akkermansiaceae bacterium]|nr:hypothetical protein [Akkermansiaceae bacterium]
MSDYITGVSNRIEMFEKTKPQGDKKVGQLEVDKELLKQLDDLSDSDARSLLVESLEQGIEVEELLIRLDSEYAELVLESVWINKLRKKNKRKREKLRFVVIENQKQEDFFEELFAQDLEGKEAA